MFSDPVQILRLLNLHSGMNVADFGAGTGAYTLPLAHAVAPSGRVYAVDVHKAMLDRLHQTMLTNGIHNGDVVWGDMEIRGGTRLRDGSLQAVIIANTLFQCKDKTAALREALRVLEPDGQILIVEWKDSFGGLGPAPEHIISPATLEHLLGELGYGMITVHQVGEHQYAITSKKSSSLIKSNTA
jgi:ubiquinone/menaquinone biosynthesis C-methylase UbiE